MTLRRERKGGREGGKSFGEHVAESMISKRGREVGDL